ncbi:MAG: hypothetical protein JXD22_11880, partial [Sedimentisphaerales bacterium]|nr:hypothetical protein [Sedimentisphaerales bacterium]
MGGGSIYYRADELKYLIQNATNLDNWEEYAEEDAEVDGTIEVYGTNSLIIKQTRKIHREIVKLIEELRKTFGEQVSLELRILEINANFLEDIGLDIDFYLHLGNAGYDQTGNVDDVTGRQILTPRTNPGSAERWTPIAVNQSSATLSQPTGTILPGSLGGGSNTGFTLAGSFLDNIQVDFLMRATQAHQRSRFLDAPHLTVFNGEMASVNFTVTQPYVSRLEAVVDNRIGIYEPEIDDAYTGVTFYVTPIISADKRHVILYGDFNIENVLRMETFTFNVGASSTSADTTPEGGLLVEGSNASTGRIQQPVTEINSVVTRVQVPDGGTLLLGGRKRTVETEKEVGVPALSKIPLLQRLFTNRGKIKDESVLIFLVKPKIILPDEEEEKRFGNFGT